MRHSESIGELAAALAKAQTAMKGAVADSTNPHFKSRYADLESVRAACLPALAANGVAVIQEASETVCVTKLVHASGQWLETEVPVILAKKDMQGVGSAITYARRYGLAAAVCLSQTDDDANSACPAPEAPKPAPRPAPAPKPAAKPEPKPETPVSDSPRFDRSVEEHYKLVPLAAQKAGIPVARLNGPGVKAPLLQLLEMDCVAHVDSLAVGITTFFEMRKQQDVFGGDKQ